MLILGPKFNVANKDKRVKKIFELTKSGQIKWEPKELDRQKWTISFESTHEGKSLILSKRSEAPGRWYISQDSSLEARNKAGELVWSVAYYNKWDHVETLDAGGDIGVELLVAFVIEKFRKQLDLHWSIH